MTNKSTNKPVRWYSKSGMVNTEITLQRYRDWSPTQFDSRGLGLNDPDEDNRQDWYVCPVTQTRDSQCLERSNFASFLAALGKSDTVEVHRFGHWGPGWFEIILVSPLDPLSVLTAQELSDALEDCPVVDEDHYSRIKNEQYDEDWHNFMCRDFARAISDKLTGSCEVNGHELDAIEDILYDADSDALREWYESLVPSGEYWRDDDIMRSIDSAVKKLTLDDVYAWIDEQKAKGIEAYNQAYKQATTEKE